MPTIVTLRGTRKGLVEKVAYMAPLSTSLRDGGN